MGGWLFGALDLVVRETALFAAAGFLFLGISDLLVDFIYIVGRLCGGHSSRRADALGPPAEPGRLVVFVPAWDEALVIGEMLRNALARFRHEDYFIYVGAYPNDTATIDAVRAVADPRVRLVVGPVDGPTTKGDCLNRLWQALVEDERQWPRKAKAIILHDAEDWIHPDELAIFDRLIEDYDLVQLPVVPLIDRSTSAVSAVYGDEFAESHGKELVVREALGASIPSAGVGCAFSRDALAEIARRSGGVPFGADSLTEDYELGLKLHAAGRRATFARLRSGSGPAVVATKEYFPGSMDAAISQKARWITGIALSGWDRLGWGGGLAERWMRLRDRQSVFAAVVLLAGYGALFFWLLLELLGLVLGETRSAIGPRMALLFQANSMIFVWRLSMRFAFVTRVYGWRQGLRSLPRVLVGNMIAIMAAYRAVFRYLRIRRTGQTRWDKTVHAFPTEVPAE